MGGCCGVDGLRWVLHHHHVVILLILLILIPNNIVNTQARGEKMTSTTEQQLCYELKTFLLAGHETSAAMLSWTLYELTQDPESMAKV